MPLLTIGRNRQNAISVKETISVLHEEAPNRCFLQKRK